MHTQELIPDSLNKEKKKARIRLELFCALDSSLRAFPNTFQIYWLKCLFGFKLIAPSTSLL